MRLRFSHAAVPVVFFIGLLAGGQAVSSSVGNDKPAGADAARATTSHDGAARKDLIRKFLGQPDLLPADLYACPAGSTLVVSSITGSPAGCESPGPPACNSASYTCQYSNGAVKDFTQDL